LSPIPEQTKDAVVDRLLLSLEPEPVHQQTLHHAKTHTPPWQTSLPGSFIAKANTTVDRETNHGLQDGAFKKEVAPMGVAAARSKRI
jgi:cell division protein FtsN